MWIEGSGPTGSCWNPAVTTVTFVRSLTTRYADADSLQVRTDLEAALGEGRASFSEHYRCSLLADSWTALSLYFCPSLVVKHADQEVNTLCPSVFWLCNRLPKDETGNQTQKMSCRPSNETDWQAVEADPNKLWVWIYTVQAGRKTGRQMG